MEELKLIEELTEEKSTALEVTERLLKIVRKKYANIYYPYKLGVYAEVVTLKQESYSFGCTFSKSASIKESLEEGLKICLLDLYTYLSTNEV